MKRFATTIITLIILPNVLPMTAFACGGGGGYRPSIRPYYGSAAVYQPAPVYRQPVIQRHVVRQPIVSQPAIRTSSAQPQIRIAPTQRTQLATTQPSQTSISRPSVPQASNSNSNRTTQPQVTNPTTDPTTTPAPNNSGNSNVNSALALLAGQQPQQPSSNVTPPTTTAKHVGTWTATVGSDATVQLSLQADGSFQWVASKGGKQSRFDGQFTISDGTLTLARSSDNQKLSGSMSFNGQGFNFKLNGAKDAGLNFTQQS